ncbi:sugar nucleotidyltransferase [Candidatus Scalindua japonica]|uniref:Sugar nucleotidyltransferase n=1 Tax=Candidatus Scalindua japonica TaxID=1284222 RepID=A0A286U450_9BACT|nr:MarR family EPS-associated transcriptional regulator [Candidatus Scalindua japonica]GAX62905.1 sugar nucleotidyltransferase [Candidatus Scalindua japonica]
MKYLEETVKLLNHIQDNPDSTQRELVKKLDFSLGKVNYLIKTLTKRGTIKLERFKKSSKKAGYLYLLTPKGIQQKTEITRIFLKQKLNEYDRLQEEIQILSIELDNAGEKRNNNKIC